MRFVAISLIISLIWLAMCPTALVFADAEADLTKLLDDAWEYRLETSPMFATMVGDNRHNDRLDEVGLAASQRDADANREFLRRLESIDRAALSHASQINCDIFGRLLRDGLQEFDFQSHLMPITNRDGFHVQFPEYFKEVPLKDLEDFENYISRLHAFRSFARGHVELMRQGIRQGMVLPDISLEGYEEVVEPHIVEDPAKSTVYQPLLDPPESIAESDVQRLRESAQQAIQASVVPGYREFFEFLRDEYVPVARGTIAASALPNGRDFYRFRVRKFTTLDLTPEQVHQTGLDEVARIRGEMAGVIKKAGFDGTMREFVEFLRSDERFYPKTDKDLMEFTALVCKKMDGELPNLFGKLPRTPYGLREIPAFVAPRTTSAYYMPPAGDGSRAGFYYVNTYNLKGRPLYDVEALSLHEAVPGHHLQIALQQELEGIPPFRKFADVTAFIEGWGLYSERLGLEVGFYEDPYSDFGRLSFEAWRACRLVVDTGMHYLGWSRQQAIDYMAENTGLSLHNITAEVDRYISWPGQALAYKTGELTIRRLRREAEETLGDRFDVREFHDVVLGNGAVPLDVLEMVVREWVSGKSRSL
jgi:uncharacterized protein (DUF885 family)